MAWGEPSGGGSVVAMLPSASRVSRLQVCPGTMSNSIFLKYLRGNLWLQPWGGNGHPALAGHGIGHREVAVGVRPVT